MFWRLTSIDTSTGEVLAQGNEELTTELVAKLAKAGITQFKTLYFNDVDRGPFMSLTLRADPSTTPLEAMVEIYKMMRPGEPPTKDSAEAFVPRFVLHRRSLRPF